MKIARISREQHGVFSRDQALKAGVSPGQIRARIEAGRWERMHLGVYSLAGHRTTWRQRLLGACFAWGPDAVASHRSFAGLRNLVGFERAPVELIVPEGRDRERRGVLVHRIGPLPEAEVTRVDGIPVTTTARGLIDLAGVVPRNLVDEAIDDALKRGLVSLGALGRQLSVMQGKGRRGTGVMRALLDVRDPIAAVPESRLETWLLRVLRDAGLPPAPQYRVRDDDRRVVARVDFAYPDVRVAVEADGRLYHTGNQWQRDLARRNLLTSLGWSVVHVTWNELRDHPGEVVRNVRRALDMARRRLSP